MSHPTLDQKVAVIAGGGKNLGALIARQFVDAGAKGLVLHYNSDGSRDETERTAAALKERGADVLTVQGDLSVVAHCQQLFDRAQAHFGQVNVAVNTAGLVIKKPILQVTEDDYDRSFAANSKEFGARGINVNAIGPGPMDTPFFYGQESKESAAYHATAAALSGFSRKGLTDIEDIAPIVRFLVTEGWWITGQTIFANGGYTTR